MFREQGDKTLLQRLRVHLRAIVPEQQIHLRAHAELARPVDAGLDCHGCARQQTSGIVRFVIVQVRAGAVDFGPQTVSCAMEELLGISGSGKQLPHVAVHLVASDRLSAGNCTGDELDCSIACSAQLCKRLGKAIRRNFAGVRHPGDIGVERIGRVGLCPDVNEYQVAQPNRRRILRCGGVVRIGCPLCARNDGGMVGHQPLLPQPLQQELLHSVLLR
jgi:hypothetical protein